MKNIYYFLVVLVISGTSIKNTFGQGGAIGGAYYIIKEEQEQKERSNKENHKRNEEYLRQENNSRRGMTDPGGDYTFFYSATKRAAENNVSKLLTKVNATLKFEAKNKKTKCTKVGENTTFEIKPGKFQIKSQKDGLKEYAGKFYGYNFRISNKYVYISNYLLTINYLDGRFHTTDFSNIPCLEDFLISILEDMTSK